MSIDDETVRRVARLARLGLSEADVPVLRDEINGVLGFVSQLQDVDVSAAGLMTSVLPGLNQRLRADVVTQGSCASEVCANAPQSEDHYFLVPKVVE